MEDEPLNPVMVWVMRIVLFVVVLAIAGVVVLAQI